MTNEPEIFEVLKKIRYDLTAAQAKLTDALNILADMNLPAPVAGELECKCGARFHTEHALAMHQANVHGGPPVPLTEHEQQA